MNLKIKCSKNDISDSTKKGLSDTINGKYYPLTIEEIGQIDAEYLLFLHKHKYTELKKEVLSKLMAEPEQIELPDEEMSWLYD